MQGRKFQYLFRPLEGLRNDEARTTALLCAVLEKCCFHLKVAFLLSSKMSLLFTISEINVVVYFLENLHFNLAWVSTNINSAVVPTINQKIVRFAFFCNPLIK